MFSVVGDGVSERRADPGFCSVVNGHQHNRECKLILCGLSSRHIQRCDFVTHDSSCCFPACVIFQVR